jgi:hypothetical protein
MPWRVTLLTFYFLLASITAIYWWINDPSKIWPAVTAMLIIACPCALLLSNTFTNGNVLRILGRNHFYLRNAETIETLATADHIVFDKTEKIQDYLKQKGESVDENKVMAVVLILRGMNLGIPFISPVLPSSSRAATICH